MKKNKNDSKIFSLSLSLCYLPDAKNELSSQQSAQQSCTPYVQKNIHQISRKITKRSKNESNFETWKKERNILKASFHLSSPFFINIIRVLARGDEGVTNQIWSTRNRNNSMTESDAGNQTRSSSPSFNEFHALLCPYSFAQARVHAYPTRSSR